MSFLKDDMTKPSTPSIVNILYKELAVEFGKKAHFMGSVGIEKRSVNFGMVFQLKTTNSE